jgi:L-fuculose-phosphate aldolase
VAYRTPTTSQLAEAAASPLKSSPAILLQNHGVIVTGETVKKAHLRLTLLEEASAIYLDALAVGMPRILSESDRQALDDVTGGRYRLR